MASRSLLSGFHSHRVVTSPTCSVNIKDAKRPKVVVSITAGIVTVPDRYWTGVSPSNALL